MDTRTVRTWAEISLENLAHNYRTIRQALPPECRFLALMKADAYGHGAVPAAFRMAEAGADYMGVACFDEAAELRQAGIRTPILILGPSPVCYALPLAEMDVTQAVASLEAAEALSEALRGTGRRLRVHIKLDTGMGRTGFRAADPADLGRAARAMRLPGLEVEGIFTHFAVSDEPEGETYTRTQFARFQAAVRALEAQAGRPFAIRHCANAGAVVRYRDEMCLDMVRPGLLLYGLYPGSDTGGLDLRPVMQLKTRVATITEHEIGDSISYGRTFVCHRPTRLAVLPVGYADGLHRVLSNQMQVLVRGQRAPQVGRICMDLCMVDITDIPDCSVGDVVTIFGQDADAFLPVEEQAKKAGTISYEMVCAVSRRVPRVYR